MSRTILVRHFLIPAACVQWEILAECRQFAVFLRGLANTMAASPLYAAKKIGKGFCGSLSRGAVCG